MLRRKCHLQRPPSPPASSLKPSNHDSLQVLQALQAELASTRLTTSDIWLQASSRLVCWQQPHAPVQAGLELKLALEVMAGENSPKEGESENVLFFQGPPFFF